MIIVVYLIETDPAWTPRAAARLSALCAAGDEVAVSDAALLECLIDPLASGDRVVEADYRAFFTNPLVKLLPVSRATWERAAQLGASFNFKPMDSLHLATAIEHGCGMF